jgi:hypothetical protein
MFTILVVFLVGHSSPLLGAASCEERVRNLNVSLDPRVDEQELVLILRTLNETDNRSLPARFVTKSRARKLGWKPGEDLWANERLKGKSMGGDSFGNREGRLPQGKRSWREADLDYKGGRRGPKRIVYSDDGQRWITVDHYKTFKEVPPCR